MHPWRFLFLTKNLGLPVAWDLNDYGFFISGGISVGNINLELLQSSDGTKNQGIFPDRFGVIGLAFQPGLPIEQKIPVLDQKKILHGQPEPFIIDPGRTNRILWTNLYLEEFMPETMVFYCEYAYVQDKRRDELESALSAKGGGLLELKGSGE